MLKMKDKLIGNKILKEDEILSIHGDNLQEVLDDITKENMYHIT